MYKVRRRYGTVSAVFRAGLPTVCTARHSAPHRLSATARHLTPAIRRGAELLSPPPEEAALEAAAEETAVRNSFDVADDSLSQEESLPAELSLTKSEPNGDEPAQNEPAEGAIANL